MVTSGPHALDHVFRLPSGVVGHRAELRVPDLDLALTPFPYGSGAPILEYTKLYEEHQRRVSDVEVDKQQQQAVWATSQKFGK